MIILVLTVRTVCITKKKKSIKTEKNSSDNKFILYHILTLSLKYCFFFTWKNEKYMIVQKAPYYFILICVYFCILLKVFLNYNYLLHYLP